jgi:hypothetical protein
VAGPQPRGDEGSQLIVPRARRVPIGYEPPTIGLNDRRSEGGLFVLEKASPGGRLADAGY